MLAKVLFNGLAIKAFNPPLELVMAVGTFFFAKKKVKKKIFFFLMAGQSPLPNGTAIKKKMWLPLTNSISM